MGLGVCGPLQAGTRETGNLLSYALPLGTLAVELARGDREGAWQFAQTAAVSLAATEVLKHVTHVERPDRSNDESFPSGHATRAFMSAAYVHQRHGLLNAAPLYVAASYVGHSRVDARRHRWVDVAGSAALSMAAAWWLVEPSPKRALVVPMLGHRSIGIALVADF